MYAITDLTLLLGIKLISTFLSVAGWFHTMQQPSDILMLQPMSWFSIYGYHHHNVLPLQWPHNEHDGVSNHQPHDCLFSRLFKAQIKETTKLRVTGLCERNSPVTGEFPTQRASNAENVSVWWRHHASHPHPHHEHDHQTYIAFVTRYVNVQFVSMTKST